MHSKSNCHGRLAGKNVIVTGAAGGIGLETSILLAREGAAVLMAGRTLETLQRAAARVAQTPLSHGSAAATARVDFIQCDVSREADVQRMVEHVDAWGGVDIMFNNAAHVSEQDGGAVETTDEAWDLTQATNVKGVWYGCKHAVLSFRRHGKAKGSVINNASIVALMGSGIPQLAYTASKGAVLAMTRELAIAHAREGFRFNSLVPGPVRTPALNAVFDRDAQGVEARAVHWPSGRTAECIEQAYAVVFLASDESSFVSGTDFVVDGGLTKAYVTASGAACSAPNNDSGDFGQLEQQDAGGGRCGGSM